MKMQSGTSSVQVLQGVEFEVEPREDHAFEVERLRNFARDKEQHSAHELFRYIEDINEAAFAVATVEKIYAHESSLNFNDTITCEVISIRKDGLKENMDARSDVYVLSNGCKECSNDINDYYWEYTSGLLVKAKGNVHGLEIIKDQSDNTLRVLQSRFHYGKLVQTLLEGHIILSLDGSLSGTMMWKRESDGTLNDATPRSNEVISPFVVDDTVATSAGNAPSSSLYANVTSKPSGKKLNFRTLFTPGGNGIDVVVLVESIRTISERFANTSYGFFLGKRVAYPIVANYVWICQILQENSQKRTRERMSDQEAKEIKAEAREIMPQPST
ncbi:hypothetical protein Tco_0805473, partial [Tanacetum coccineum]